MPRGNLEIIHPRAIVVKAVCKFVSQGEYGKAFALARRHRVDLNLISDVNFPAFLENSALVVQQLGKADYINLLLSSLMF